MRSNSISILQVDPCPATKRQHLHKVFTQSIPLSLVFDRAKTQKAVHSSFCEVSRDATDMTCFQDLETWLFRDEEESTNMATYSIKQRDKGRVDSNNRTAMVLHKLIVLLPDVKLPTDFEALERFLLSSNDDPTSNSIQTHRYGSKAFYQKYRAPSVEELTPRFNLVDE